MFLEINRIVKSTESEGFGKRYCIWVQGCSIKCNDCINKQALNKGEGMLVNIYKIISDILETPDIEGITFLGGEPFDQALELYIIGKEIKKRDLSIITFTGYEHNYLLKANKKEYHDLLGITDLLIDGKFDMEKYDLSRPWVGSSNQNYIFLTNRYKKEDLKYIKNKFEILIEKNGKIFINGMGNYKELMNLLSKKGWKI